MPDIRFCGPQKANPNHNGSLVLGCRSQHGWVALMRKVWREQCWCSAMLPLAGLLQPPRPWSWDSPWLQFSMAGQIFAHRWMLLWKSVCSQAMRWVHQRAKGRPRGIHLKKTVLSSQRCFHVLSVGECWYVAWSLGNLAMFNLATLAGLLPTLAWDLDCLTIPHATTCLLQDREYCWSGDRAWA